MPSDPPVAPVPHGEARPDPGLPTVTPPSGSMFFRLFGVPALIVGGLVLVLIVVQPFLGKFATQQCLARTSLARSGQFQQGNPRPGGK